MKHKLVITTTLNWPLHLVALLFFSWACQSQKSEVIPPPQTSTPPPSSNAVAQYGQLRVQGNRIVDKNNNPVQLRGMSLFWSQWIRKYYTPKR